jgi:hypothetical protein
MGDCMDCATGKLEQTLPEEIGTVTHAELENINEPLELDLGG